jgi:2-alkenal reductase
MTFTRQKPFVLSIILLLLLALSCQAATLTRPAETTNGEPDTAVENAAATTETQTSEIAANNSGTALASQTLDTVNVELQGRLIELYQSTNPSVVHIFVFDNSALALGTGSGFIFDASGHIVTNNHVVTNSATLEVVFADGERRRANLVGTDIDSDLAVIRVDSLPADVQPLPVGDSANLQVGQFVVAIGNPFGEAGSMSIGIISGLGRTLESQRLAPGGTFSIPQVIQTDAAINPGNSGGPLLNLNGEVIGVNSAILSRTGANSGVGFSIPINAVKNIAPALIEDGSYSYPYIGISMSSLPFTLTELERLDLPPNGVYITDVTEGTPAAEAGLIGSGTTQFNEPLPGGDYITAINGTPVRTSDELVSYLVFETEVGETVQLTILRSGEEITVPLTLGQRP